MQTKLKSLPLMAVAMSILSAVQPANSADSPGSRTQNLTFTGIKIELPASLTVTRSQTSTGKVTIQVDPPELLSSIKTEMKGPVLLITSVPRPNNLKSLVVTAETKTMNSLATLGSCEGVVNGMNGGDLSISTSGSAKVTVNGKVQTLNANMSGSATLLAAGLDADAVVIKITGAGKADVSAKTALDVSIVGSGNVRYKGSPSLTKRVVGSGTVVKIP